MIVEESMSGDGSPWGVQRRCIGSPPLFLHAGGFLISSVKSYSGPVLMSRGRY